MQQQKKVLDISVCLLQVPRVIRSCLGVLHDAFLNVRDHCRRMSEVERCDDVTLFFGNAVFPDSGSKVDGFACLGCGLVRFLQCGANHVGTQV